MINIGINGFGRIGRIALRAILARYSKRVRPMVINTSGSMGIEGWAHLFEYDSVYGRYKSKVSARGRSSSGRKSQKLKVGGGEIGCLKIGSLTIPVLAQRIPEKINWRKYQAKIILECTGVFGDKKSASAHFQGGAEKVIISAPSKDTETFVIGVNEPKYRGDLVVNNGSCTTGCVAPVTKVILENFGIQKALMTTIHAYTADQELVDGSHKDLRRARAAAINIVPTSTGAAIATTEVLPQLKGLFAGLAYRVPIVCGSVADFSFVTTRRTTIEEVNKAFINAAKGKLKGIIEVSDKPLVSTDIIGNSASAIVDLSLTKVIDGDLVKVVAWYDNEWGYACRLVEMAILTGSK